MRAVSTLVSELSLPEIVDRRAAEEAGRVAVRFLANGETETGQLTYADLAGRAQALAGHIARRARRGERALLAFPAGFDFMVAFLACLHAGVIAVPVDVRRRHGNANVLAAIARNSGASLFLAHSDLRDRLPDLGRPWVFSDALEQQAPGQWTGPSPAPDSIAYLQYTSGSTQMPRGAAISHRALMEQLEFYRRRGGPDWQELLLVGWLPHTHDFGLVGFILSALYMGTPLIAMPPGAFLRRPLRWLEAISAYRGSFGGGPNFGYELCASAGARGLASDIDLSCWKIASLGGDHIAPGTLERFEAAFAPFGFRKSSWLPAYGLAESVLCATGRQGVRIAAFDAAALREKVAVPADDTEAPVRLVSCGRPMPGQTVRIVDPVTHAPRPEAAVGEIWLAGASLADGYWNEADATPSHFDARLADSETPHLRTGDCGFMLDGELFVTGRLKDLVIVHGKNHAPEDIEATVQAVHPGLRAGCGAVVQAAGHVGAALIAIQEMARGDGLDVEPLLGRIAMSVSERHGLALDEIILIRPGSLPRTGSGKICRRDCLADFEAGRLRRVASWRRSAPVATSSPAQSVERHLLALLRETLPARDVTPDRNLFELGLDSLAIQTLLGRLEESVGRVIAPDVLFDAPTVSALAARLAAEGVREAASSPGEPSDALSLAGMRRELRRLSDAVVAQDRRIAELAAALGGADRLAGRPAPLAAGTIAPDTERTVFPLNETQREVSHLAELREDARALFNLVMVLEHDGPLDIDAVRNALRGLVRRHEALRTIFGDDTQRVLADAEPALEDVLVANQAALRDWLRSERRRPFAPGHAPPWRAALVRCDRSTFLVFIAGHLVLDASSLPTLARELAALLARDETALPPPLQFREFCAEREERRRTEALVAQRDYWRAALGDSLSDFAMPGEAKRRRTLSYDAGVHHAAIDGGLRDALLGGGAAASATLFQTLLGAYFVLLHRVSGQTRFAIGIDASDRCVTDGADVIGCCGTILPIVMEFTGPVETQAVLGSVRRKVLEAVAHRDYTMAMWARDACIAPDPGRPFKVAAAIRMQRAAQRVGGFTSRCDLESGSLSQSPFGLMLDVREGDDGVRLDFIYNEDLYDAAQIERYARYYLRLLKAAARDVSADILALPMLSEAEAAELAAIGRAGGAPADYAPFLDRFDAQVRATPDAEAVCGETMQLSYRQLQAQGRRIAHAIAREAPAGTTVALLAERDSGFLAGLIGIFGAGCACLALDPMEPDVELLEHMVQASAGLLLHDAPSAGLAARLCAPAKMAARTLDLSKLAGTADAPGTWPAAGDTAEDAAAYLTVGPGSAGAPRVVAVSHAGMTSHLEAKRIELSLQPSDRVAQTAPQHLDSAIWQFLAPLLVGARVCVMADSAIHDPRALFARVQQQAISVVELAPSVVREAIEILLEPAAVCPLRALRWLVCTGEALPAELCRRWISLYPHVPVLNAHGLAECSGAVAHHVAEWPPAPEVVRVPIGRPIAGAELYVVDRAGGPAPRGAVGELLVGGICIGRDAPEDAAATFVSDRFSQRPGACLRRSGDLVRILDDGSFDYLGRIDRQVTINGERIEPREIEAAILRDSAVLESHVMAKPDAAGRVRLAAYVVFRAGMASSEGALKAAARRTLPPALVPSAFVMLARMPRTARGAIDAARLPEPDFPASARDQTPPADDTEAGLLEIWQATLAAPGPFGVHADFFELGGSSIEATIVAKQAEARFGVRVSIAALLRTPTISGMAALFEARPDRSARA